MSEKISQSYLQFKKIKIQEKKTNCNDKYFNGKFKMEIRNKEKLNKNRDIFHISSPQFKILFNDIK